MFPATHSQDVFLSQQIHEQGIETLLNNPLISIERLFRILTISLRRSSQKKDIIEKISSYQNHEVNVYFGNKLDCKTLLELFINDPIEIIKENKDKYNDKFISSKCEIQKLKQSFNQENSRIEKNFQQQFTDLNERVSQNLETQFHSYQQLSEENFQAIQSKLSDHFNAIGEINQELQTYKQSTNETIQSIQSKLSDHFNTIGEIQQQLQTYKQSTNETIQTFQSRFSDHFNTIGEINQQLQLCIDQQANFSQTIKQHMEEISKIQKEIDRKKK